MEGNTCSIVMYHYVRDLVHTRFPNIKGLDIEKFKQQIDFLEKNYHLITMEELIYSYETGSKLPINSALLTFDDGYKDHYDFVFPILDRKKIQGCFYIPAQTVMEHLILDVNKIHFILEVNNDSIELLSRDIFKLLDDYREAYTLNSNDWYYNKLAIPSRFDTKDVIFIKRLLQVELVEELRSKMIDILFEKYVSSDQKAFSRELYMSEEQIQCMQRNGMHIGGHGYSHYWLGSLDRDKQEREIHESKKFIQNIGGDINNWTMCYPYGNYNSDTLELLGKYNCKIGLTTEVGAANLNIHKQYELPRLDTNDIWTLQNLKSS
ncbi:MAG: polysaccharide deacetylase family protein [Chitinophagales bacterium]|nr:polysaccharide deacetylase family protein [Chitinophagales bacterium]